MPAPVRGIVAPFEAVRFPQGSSLGIVYRRAAGAGGEWRVYAEARGQVEFDREFEYAWVALGAREAVLEALLRMPPGAVHSLDLRYVPMTDADLRGVGRLTGLKSLTLAGPEITDVGLEALNGLKRLEFLALEETSTTARGRSLLLGALPRCRLFTRAPPPIAG